jgi:acetylornithine deacetylase
MKGEIVDRVSRLIRIPSVNPDYPGQAYDEWIGGEAEANQLVEEWYREAGCRIEHVEASPGRPNLIGVLSGRDPKTAKSLIMNGHVDVVPPGLAGQWSDGEPFSGRVTNERIFGRGASDQKSAVVSAVMAATAIGRAGFQLAGDLILESVVGEEVGEYQIGTGAVINAGFRADGAIVTEPTAPVCPDPLNPPTLLLIAPVTAGLLWMTLEVIGKRGHNNLRPHLVRAGGVGEAAGVSAIEKGVYLLTALQHLEQQWGQKYTHPLFDPGHFSLHPGVITGGTHGAQVPFFISEFCRIDYSILYPPMLSSLAIEAEIEEFVGRASSLDPWLEKNPPRVTWQLDWPPSVLGADHSLTRTVACARRDAIGESRYRGPGRDPAIRAFQAVDDATFFNLAGIPAISCGPGSIQFAHAIDENVAIGEVIAATKLYAFSAVDWCGLAPA